MSASKPQRRNKSPLNTLKLHKKSTISHAEAELLQEMRSDLANRRQRLEEQINSISQLRSQKQKEWMRYHILDTERAQQMLASIPPEQTLSDESTSDGNTPQSKAGPNKTANTPPEHVNSTSQANETIDNPNTKLEPTRMLSRRPTTDISSTSTIPQAVDTYASVQNNTFPTQTQRQPTSGDTQMLSPRRRIHNRIEECEIPSQSPSRIARRAYDRAVQSSVQANRSSMLSGSGIDRDFVTNSPRHFKGHPDNDLNVSKSHQSFASIDPLAHSHLLLHNAAEVTQIRQQREYALRSATLHAEELMFEYYNAVAAGDAAVLGKKEELQMLHDELKKVANQLGYANSLLQSKDQELVKARQQLAELVQATQQLVSMSNELEEASVSQVMQPNSHDTIERSGPVAISGSQETSSAHVRTTTNPSSTSMSNPTSTAMFASTFPTVNNEPLHLHDLSTSTAQRVHGPSSADSQSYTSSDIHNRTHPISASLGNVASVYRNEENMNFSWTERTQTALNNANSALQKARRALARSP